jgi:hypothetical protein
MEWVARHHLFGMKLGADDGEQHGRMSSRRYALRMAGSMGWSNPEDQQSWGTTLCGNQVTSDRRGRCRMPI